MLGDLFRVLSVAHPLRSFQLPSWSTDRLSHVFELHGNIFHIFGRHGDMVWLVESWDFGKEPVKIDGEK